MDTNSDEWWESRGFKKIFIPEHNCFGWSIEIDVPMPENLLESKNIGFLEHILELHLQDAEPEDYEMAAKLRDRINELKNGNDTAEI